MAAAISYLSADQITVGDRLPDLKVPVTATTIVLGASATRDFQPQHHDHAWCVRVGLRDIIMNTPNQAGWISRFVTDWAGPMARLGRIAFKMLASICPGDLLVISGTVVRMTTDRAGCSWIDVAVQLRVGETLCTTTTVTLAVPSVQGADSPWRRGPERWLIAELPRYEPPARQ